MSEPKTLPAVVSSEIVRPVCRKAVTLKANLTACTLTMYDAREQIARELRRIADMVEEGDTLSESGNMGICDYGSWALPDPWEGPNATELGFPPILDACCGGRQFWFDKENPNVLFADCRVMPDKVVGTGKDARTRRCLPDRVHDFRAMEYPDDTFQLVVFDPPHLFLGENSFMAQSYGRLDRETWREDISRGFAECFRVLKVGGVLIFKWNECDIPLAEILKCTPNKPLFGHPSGKAQKTHWCAFWKPNAPHELPPTKTP